MDNKKKLFLLLNEPSSPDYWSDYAINIAIDLIEKMSADDWTSVSKDLRCLERDATIRLLELMDESFRFPVQEEILLSYLMSTEEEITETALSSVNSLFQQEQLSKKGREFVRKNIGRLNANGSIAQVLKSAIAASLEYDESQ